MRARTLTRTLDTGTYIFGWFNDAGDRGFTAMGKQLDRMARRSPGGLRRQLKGAAKTLKRSDLSDLPAGIASTVRRHPYGTIFAGTAALYLIQRWRRR
jgi:hypothetical protein